jgi:hypothetical protein
MSLRREWIASPNYSSRGGTGVRIIVLHTAEGATTYQSLGSFFANPASQVSSHVGIDDTPGVIGEYVRADQKAWTAANANPYAVQAELCAFAAWSPADWDTHPVMLENTALWVAEEAARFGIPLRHSTDHGVCQHVDLGAAGGGHWDCGPSFPFGRVLEMAGGAPGSTPTPPPSGGGSAPPFPGTLLSNFTTGHGTSTWQRQMAARGWTIAVDDLYGGQSEDVCMMFQREKGLSVDGVVGPITWDATWTAPVT